MRGSPRWRARWALAAFVVAMVVIRTVTTTLHLNGAGADGGLLIGGVHIHHMVFGLALLLVLMLAWLLGAGWASDRSSNWWAPAMFGVAWALVLDESALILNLADVYWAPLGEESLIAALGFALVLGVASLVTPPAPRRS